MLANVNAVLPRRSVLSDFCSILVRVQDVQCERASGPANPFNSTSCFLAFDRHRTLTNNTTLLTWYRVLSASTSG